MSEANDRPSRKLSPSDELTVALLQLFELVVAAARDEETLDRLSEWADEHKPRLERVLRRSRE